MESIKSRATDLRILHVYRTYFPDSQGGLEEVIRQICLGTAPHKIQSRVLSVSSDPEIRSRATKRVVRLQEAAVYRAKQTFEIASCNVSIDAFRMHRRLADWADVVHYHFPWPLADLLRLSSPKNKPSVLTYHSDIVRQRVLGALYWPLMNRFLSSVDRIVCTSPNYFATSDVLSRFESKVDVIPIGIDANTYPEPSVTKLDELRSGFGTEFFLFVGVLRYYKGLHILIDAIKDAKYDVVIVGSGPTEQALRAQATRMGLNNVKFTGHVSDETKVGLFHLARGVVFPSYLRSEAFGVTLLEGAMYGKPLISTEVGSGTSHVNIDGETGLVVTPGSSKDLRHAMDHLHFRPDMARLMGQRARARYEQLFTGALMGSKYVALYRDLTGNPTSAGRQPAAKSA